MRLNGIRHTTSAPYHPATNGLAERAVQTFKSFLKKSPSMPLEDALSRFLHAYRITPHSTTGTSPAELLFNCRLRSRLDLVFPDLTGRVHDNQQRQKLARDQHAKFRSFEIGDTVFVRDLPSKKDWLPGTICQIFGPCSYLIRLSDGRTIRRHIDHLIDRSETDPDSIATDPSPAPDWSDIPDIELSPPSTSNSCIDPVQGGGSSTPPLRRSSRVSVPPDRYM